LHGADWALNSTVELQCFPEGEIVLSVEEGRGVLQHPITERVRFWIVKQGGVIYAKIVESSGSKKLDMDALDLVTSHKCGLPNGENCRAQSARVIVYM
jgi:TonB family protein